MIGFKLAFSMVRHLFFIKESTIMLKWIKSLKFLLSPKFHEEVMEIIESLRTILYILQENDTRDHPYDDDRHLGSR